MAERVAAMSVSQESSVLNRELEIRGGWATIETAHDNRVCTLTRALIIGPFGVHRGHRAWRASEDEWRVTHLGTGLLLRAFRGRSRATQAAKRLRSLYDSHGIDLWVGDPQETVDRMLILQEVLAILGEYEGYSPQASRRWDDV